MKLVIRERVTLEGLTHLPGAIEVDEARAAKLLAVFKGGEISTEAAHADGGLIEGALAMEPNPMETFVPASAEAAPEPTAVEKALEKLGAQPAAAEAEAEPEPVGDSAPEEPEAGKVGRGKSRSKR